MWSFRRSRWKWSPVGCRPEGTWYGPTGFGLYFLWILVGQRTCCRRKRKKFICVSICRFVGFLVKWCGDVETQKKKNRNPKNKTKNLKPGPVGDSTWFDFGMHQEPLFKIFEKRFKLRGLRVWVLNCICVRVSVHCVPLLSLQHHVAYTVGPKWAYILLPLDGIVHYRLPFR